MAKKPSVNIPTIDPLAPLASPSPKGTTVQTPTISSAPNQIVNYDPLAVKSPGGNPDVMINVPGPGSFAGRPLGHDELVIADLVATSSRGAFQAAQRQAAYRTVEQAAQARQPFRTYPVTDRYGNTVPGCIGWEYAIWSVQGGHNKTTGDMSIDWDRASATTGIDARYDRHLILAQLTTNATTPDPTGSLVGIHHTNIFDTLAVGIGAGANVSLLIESSGAIAARTYTPSSSITGLFNGIFGGVNSPERLIIGRISAAAQVASDLAATPTIDGTMHANTTALWGLIMVPDPELQALIYSGTATAQIRTLVASGAFTDAPTNVTAVPGGGKSIGWLRPGGGSPRAFWLIPKSEVTAGAFLFGTEKACRVMSTNLLGSDLQPHDWGLNEVYGAALIPGRQGIVAWDRSMLRFFDGSVTPLNIFEDREPNSDREYTVRDVCIVDGQELYIKCQRIASTGGSGNTEEWWEWYDFNNGGFHQCSETTTLTTTGRLGAIAGAGGLPYSKQTRSMYFYSDGSWREMKAPAAGQNPFTINRQTSGAGATTGDEFASTGSYTTSIFRLPGLDGPSVIEEVMCLGDLAAGGSGTEVLIEFARQTGSAMTFTNPNLAVTFNQRVRWDKFRERMHRNTQFFDRLQMKITLTRGSDTHFTPNALPIIVRGISFMDGRPRSPLAVRGY